MGPLRRRQKRQRSASASLEPAGHAGVGTFFQLHRHSSIYPTLVRMPDPRGCAVRFPPRGTRAHRHRRPYGFPARTGLFLLEFLTAIAATDLTPRSRLAAGKICGHPPGSRLCICADSKNSPPSSFGPRETYFGLTAVRFISQGGVSCCYRHYRILPEARKWASLDAAAVAARGPNYLFDELEQPVAKGACQVSGG